MRNLFFYLVILVSFYFLANFIFSDNTFYKAYQNYGLIDNAIMDLKEALNHLQ